MTRLEYRGVMEGACGIENVCLLAGRSGKGVNEILPGLKSV